MTVVALPDTLTAPQLRRRVWNAVRMHAANPWPTLINPWLIFAAIFGLNLAVWYVVTVAAGGTKHLDAGAFTYNGGVAWILFFLMTISAQAMSLTFRFALGIGMTRRDYYLGTVAYLAILTSTYAAGITVMAQVERLTDGWGLGGRFFAPWVLADLPAGQLWYVNMMAELMLAMLGVAAGTVWVRWKAVGIYALIGTLALLGIAASWLMTVTDSWAGLAGYLGSHSPVAVVTWTLPATALCALAGYLLLQRATPQA
ncbi:MAG: hypothetical protein ACOH17_09130 [Cellulomonas sp.]